MGGRVDCFVSYAKEDANVAKELFSRLQAAGIHTFLAEESVEVGDEWAPAIRSNACQATILVLLDSASSRRSAWVQQEAGMALASGALLIPVSLGGGMRRLPGWLAGIQGMKLRRGPTFEAGITAIVDRVRNQLDPATSGFPDRILHPQTVADLVLRMVLFDQFSAPPVRNGAWSRQYDRYLGVYYGGPGQIRSDVSQGASLTFTGMIIERFLQYIQVAPSELVPLIRSSVQGAERFVLSSQHHAGGFGRRSAHAKTRGGHDPEPDVRHTCWAIRALLAIDAVRFRPVVGQALEWLAWHARRRPQTDKWCWTTAPLLAMLNDERALAYPEWSRERDTLLPLVQAELEAEFNQQFASWVSEESPEKRPWVAADNALYVLNTLSSTHCISGELLAQGKAAIRALLANAHSCNDAIGIRLYSEKPDIGPTTQLLEILSAGAPFATDLVDHSVANALELFAYRSLAAGNPMPKTYAWHLSGALSVPALRDRRLDLAER